MFYTRLTVGQEKEEEGQSADKKKNIVIVQLEPRNYIIERINRGKKRWIIYFYFIFFR